MPFTYRGTSAASLRRNNKFSRHFALSDYCCRHFFYFTHVHEVYFPRYIIYTTAAEVTFVVTLVAERLIGFIRYATWNMTFTWDTDVTRSSGAVLPQTYRATCNVSRNFVNCYTNVVGTSCTTNPQQIEVTEFEHSMYVHTYAARCCAAYVGKLP